MRPALVVASLFMALMGSASHPAGQTTVDPRPLKQKIWAFFTMELTRNAIEENIFDPVKFWLESLKGEDALVLALREPVLSSRVGYDELWRRLSSPPRPDSPDRKAWARAAAREADAVNKSLLKFKDSVQGLFAKANKVMDPSLERSFVLYAGMPTVQVGDFESFLNEASEADLNRIVDEIKQGREIVATAHDCFLCFIAKREKTAQPAGANCTVCSR